MTALPEWLVHILNFVIIPILGWNWRLHSIQGKQSTDIAVLQAKADMHKEQHRQIMDKLDGIESALRSKD